MVPSGFISSMSPCRSRLISSTMAMMLCHSLSGPPLRELLHGNEHDVIHFTPRKQVFEVTLVAVERLHGDLSKKLGTTAELPKELIGKVIPVGHNDERRIFHQLLHEIRKEDRRKGISTPAYVRRCQSGRSFRQRRESMHNRPPHSEVLVVGHQNLHRLVSRVVEADEVVNDIEATLCETYPRAWSSSLWSEYQSSHHPYSSKRHSGLRLR